MNLFGLLLATSLGTNSAWAKPQRINIAFDIQGVTMAMGMGYGRETPNFGEMLAVLAKDPRVHIHFYSTQDYRSVSDQLHGIKVPGGRRADMMGIILDGSVMTDRDRPKKKSGGWFDAPSYGSSYKDLRVVAMNEVDLANSILVDDDDFKGHPDQLANLLWMPSMLGIVDDPSWVEPKYEEPEPIPAWTEPVAIVEPKEELPQSEPPKVAESETLKVTEAKLPDPPKPPAARSVPFEPYPGESDDEFRPTLMERARKWYDRVVDSFSLPDVQPLAPHPLDRNYQSPPKPSVAAKTAPLPYEAKPERVRPEPLERDEPAKVLPPMPPSASVSSYLRPRARSYQASRTRPRLDQRADLMLGLLKVVIAETDKAPEGTTLKDTMVNLLWNGELGTRVDRNRYALYDPKLQKILIRYGRRLRNQARCEEGLGPKTAKINTQNQATPSVELEPASDAGLGPQITADPKPEVEPPVPR